MFSGSRYRNRLQTLSGIETKCNSLLLIVNFHRNRLQTLSGIETRSLLFIFLIRADAFIEIDSKPFQGLKHNILHNGNIDSRYRNRLQTLSGIETLRMKAPMMSWGNSPTSKSTPNPFRD